MEYKIIHFDETTGSVVVHYSDNMSPINVDIPLTAEGLFLEGQELDAYIKNMIPTWHLERIEKVAKGIPNAANIHALVQPLPQQQNTDEQNTAPQNADMWMQIEVEKQVAKALVKFGVLQSDPTEIPVSAQ